jgi:uncharacterized damage-inducible protein DinB
MFPDSYYDFVLHAHRPPNVKGPSMSTTYSPVIAGYRQLAGMTQFCVGANADGITHADSIVQPRAAGNSINWVLGHLLWAYDELLPVLGQAPVMAPGVLARYARGAEPLTDVQDAVPFDELMAGWRLAVTRVNAGLEALPDERLDLPAPASPSNNPDETVGSLLTTIMFHQAYHAGQVGVLRRVVGRGNAIR